MFSVFVEGLELYAYHGVPAEERVVGHRYQVDITLMVEGNADLTDRVEGTVDYALVTQLATAVVTGTQFRTVERIAASIADSILDAFELAIDATVTVRKLLPPMPAIAAAAGATVIRKRTS